MKVIDPMPASMLCSGATTYTSAQDNGVWKMADKATATGHKEVNNESRITYWRFS